MHFVVTFGNLSNGWSSTAAYPKFGDDYWFRATANFGGIWWNSSNEAVYELLHVDANGNPTTGDTTYQLTFTADQLPNQVVDCFWSLTVYGKPDYMLVPNPAGRYNVSTRSGLAFDEDGSLTLSFASRAPSRRPREQLAAHSRRQGLHRRSTPLPPPRGSPQRHLVTTASRAHLVASNVLSCRCP